MTSLREHPIEVQLHISRYISKFYLLYRKEDNRIMANQVRHHSMSN